MTGQLQTDGGYVVASFRWRMTGGTGTMRFTWDRDGLVRRFVVAAGPCRGCGGAVPCASPIDTPGRFSTGAIGYVDAVSNAPDDQADSQRQGSTPDRDERRDTDRVNERRDAPDDPGATGFDDEAPGNFVDDTATPDVPEPNEPA